MNTYRERMQRNQEFPGKRNRVLLAQYVKIVPSSQNRQAFQNNRYYFMGFTDHHQQCAQAESIFRVARTTVILFQRSKHIAGIGHSINARQVQPQFFS